MCSTIIELRSWSAPLPGDKQCWAHRVCPGTGTLRTRVAEGQNTRCGSITAQAATQVRASSTVRVRTIEPDTHVTLGEDSPVPCGCQPLVGTCRYSLGNTVGGSTSGYSISRYWSRATNPRLTVNKQVAVIIESQGSDQSGVSVYHQISKLAGGTGQASSTIFWAQET